VLCVPVEVALSVQPGYAVPLHTASRGQFLVICLDVAPAIIGDWRELPVVLQLVLELGELCNDAFALADGVVVFGVVEGAVHVVNGLGDDDGPSRTRRRVCKRRGVVGVVLRWWLVVSEGAQSRNYCCNQTYSL
jgi:hypothetical protein